MIYVSIDDFAAVRWLSPEEPKRWRVSDRSAPRRRELEALMRKQLAFRTTRGRSIFYGLTDRGAEAQRALDNRAVEVAERLPLPRVQFRWTALHGQQPWNIKWQCHHELVINAREAKECRTCGEKWSCYPLQHCVPNGEQVLELTKPIGRDGDWAPCRRADGQLFHDVPGGFRAEIFERSRRLPGVPMFIIAPDGTAMPLLDLVEIADPAIPF